MKSTLKTNWTKFDNLTDEDIDYSDNPEVTEDMFRLMTFRSPDKKGIFIKLDEDVIDFFKHHSNKYQVKINEVLKAYKKAFEKKLAQ